MQIDRIEKAYEFAREHYAEHGVSTDDAIKELEAVSLSVHCWQGDDVGGFEREESALSGGGIMATGSYPGKARNVGELRADLEKAYSLIPGSHRLNLHAIYGEFGGKFVDRDQITSEHYKGWVDWAKMHNLKLDFNATCFSHPKAGEFTLSHQDKGIREFWIEHVKRCREIGAYMGRELGSPCVHDLWIPDGSKDIRVDRMGPRRRLKESLDAIYATKYAPRELKDAVESKLFGLGSESYVVGSHEFYMGYAAANGMMVCLDTGHFHPTESIADKISAVLQFSDELLLHVSRGVRWDSDHVVIFNDEIRSIGEELVRSGGLPRVHLALDFFDASINRVGAWVIGSRATLKGVLAALLEPKEQLRKYEESGRYFERLALIEEAKTLPLGAVWDYYCLKMGAPAGADWIGDVERYEAAVTSKRS